MSAKVIEISKDGKAVLNKDVLKLEPVLGKLSDKDLIYIFLAYDYKNSLYKRMPADLMRQKARIHAYGKDYKKKPEDSLKVKAGIEAFESLNYNEREEERRIYKDKHRKILISLKEEVDMTSTKMSSLSKSMEFMRKEIDRVEKEQDIEEELLELKGGKKLSYIEQWQRNRDRYHDN